MDDDKLVICLCFAQFPFHSTVGLVQLLFIERTVTRLSLLFLPSENPVLLPMCT